MYLTFIFHNIAVTPLLPTQPDMCQFNSDAKCSVNFKEFFV